MNVLVGEDPGVQNYLLQNSLDEKFNIWGKKVRKCHANNYCKSF